LFFILFFFSPTDDFIASGQIVAMPTSFGRSRRTAPSGAGIVGAAISGDRRRTAAETARRRTTDDSETRRHDVLLCAQSTRDKKERKKENG